MNESPIDEQRALAEIGLELGVNVCGAQELERNVKQQVEQELGMCAVHFPRQCV